MINYEIFIHVAGSCTLINMLSKPYNYFTTNLNKITINLLIILKIGYNIFMESDRLIPIRAVRLKVKK
ncbi:hypothetical protein CTY74_07265 [Acinetobacter baumannii]|nr:hypothetical protein BKJ37_19645 [Acinetobacter baumannii]APM50940.1 hypothetical protein BS615_19675 [Acinetobacter baumannii]KPA48962.1 hypothetical protein AC795_09550 [Acinetobacter baumannii]MCO4767644.1 hypothetical protein [Acinetobacter baumannii]MDB0082921.1 hypothetical protein [Acinetobacter baumannii]